LDDYNVEEAPSNTDDVYQEDSLDGDVHIDIGEGLDNLTITEFDEVVNPKEPCKEFQDPRFHILLYPHLQLFQH
jgi:hypothetical protein